MDEMDEDDLAGAIVEIIDEAKTGKWKVTKSDGPEVYIKNENGDVFILEISQVEDFPGDNTDSLNFED